MCPCSRRSSTSRCRRNARRLWRPEELRRRQLAALMDLGDGQRTGSAAGAGTRRCALGRPDHARCLRGIAERGALAPLFVLITARPEFRAPWSTRSHHSTISLSPLDRHQVRHMVGELAARHALPKEVVDGVTERTGGVPLFVSSSRT